MIGFITENIGTIVVSIIVILIVSSIVIKLYNDKKAGKTSCGCGCENCQNSPYCHKVNQK